MSAKVLAHLDSSQNLMLACDATSYSLGAVLAHTPNWEKAGLAYIFCIKKFHDYLFSHSFESSICQNQEMGLIFVLV